MANQTMRRRVHGHRASSDGQRFLSRRQHRPEVEWLGLIPGIQVLAHGDAIETDGPHHGAPMFARGQAKIFFDALIAALATGATIVHRRPRRAIPGHRGEQAGIAFRLHLDAATVRRRGIWRVIGYHPFDHQGGRDISADRGYSRSLDLSWAIPCGRWGHPSPNR